MERLNPCRYFDRISRITPSEDEKYLENYPGCQLINPTGQIHQLNHKDFLSLWQNLVKLS